MLPGIAYEMGWGAANQIMIDRRMKEMVAENQADNWARRDEAMRCSSCMWFVSKLAATGMTATELSDHIKQGRCRRRSPTLAGWPVVFDSDWCGDHKLG